MKATPIVLVLALSAPRALADCRPEPAAVMPLVSDGRPLVEAAINGSPVRLYVDTGSEGSSVTPATVTALKLQHDRLRRTRVSTIAGDRVSGNALLDSLRVGTFRRIWLSWTILSLDGLSPDGARGQGGEADKPGGLIGADVLGGYDLELDIPGRTLTLYRAAACRLVRPPWEGDYQALPARVSKAHGFLLTAQINGQPVTALFDTGSRGETVSLRAATRVGVTEAALNQDPLATGFGAGRNPYAIRRHRLDTLTVGDETFRGAAIDVVDFNQQGVDMLLGADYMHARRFFLSYSTHTLFVQRRQDEGGAAAPRSTRSPGPGLRP